MTDTIISTIVGAIITGIFGLIGIWFNHYLTTRRNNQKPELEAERKRQAEMAKRERLAEEQRRQEEFTKQQAETTPQELSALNPLDHLRLLWWLLVMPQQLIDYRKKFGEENEKRVGKWLVSTLTWLPVLMLSLALGLEWLPHSSKVALSPETYLWISGGLVGCWLLVGWLRDLNADRRVDVAVLVASAMTIVTTSHVAVDAAFILVASAVVLGVAFAVVLISAYLFLIYFCFLGGWKLFV